MLRSRPRPLGFIELALPTSADKPPSAAGWVHEIKFDGFRLFAQRRNAGGRLLTRNGNDWSDRYLRANFTLIAQCKISRSVAACSPGIFRSIRPCDKMRLSREAVRMEALDEPDRISSSGSPKAPPGPRMITDDVGPSIMDRLAQAAARAQQDRARVMEQTHDLSLRLHAAEEQLRRTEAELAYCRDRAAHAEEWLARIHNEVEQAFFSKSAHQ
jgi:hypothetical protein